MASHETPSQAPTPKRRRRWLRWVGVATMGAIAVGSGILSSHLRDHADARRQFMEELTQLEVEATAHSMTIWRALTMLLSEEKMQFIRIRGEASAAGREIRAHLTRLTELEPSGASLTASLGFPPDPAPMDSLTASTERFLGSVQGAMGQMNLSPERLRKRLRHWDMNFGPFQESLQAVKERQGAIAEASATVARRVTAVSGLTRLLASILFVWTFSRQRLRAPKGPSSVDRPEAQMDGFTVTESSAAAAVVEAA
ncbi:hypothetical protein [Planctomycetes bacterium Poly30]